MNKPVHDIFAFYFEQYKVDVLALAACEFDLFTKLAQQPLNIEAIKDKLNIDERPAYILLESLCALGFILKTNSGYELTDISRKCLVKGSSEFMGDTLSIHSFDPGYQILKKAVMTNSCQIPERYSSEKFSEEISENIESTFIAAMENFSSQIAKELLDPFDFSGYRSILDLGGGTGSLSIEAVKKNGHLQAAILEKNFVCPFAEQKIIDCDLQERIQVFEGDIFSPPFPPGNDLVFLANILHGRNPDKNQTLLKEIREYLPDGGGILILELLSDNEKLDPKIAALFSVDMLIWSEGGRQYSGQEISSWLIDSAYKNITVDHSSGLYSTIFASV